MIKEIPVKIQKYLKTRKIQLTFKVNYISLVKKDTIFRGLSDKPKTHSIRWHATMKRELLCTSRRARAFPTYTTRPFYVVRQSFVDKFRVSELRSTNSKDELWDQRPCTMTIWVPLTSGTHKKQNNSVLVSRCVLQLTARNLYHDLVSLFLYIRCTKNLSRCSGRKMTVMIYGQYCKSTLKGNWGLKFPFYIWKY